MKKIVCLALVVVLLSMSIVQAAPVAARAKRALADWMRDVSNSRYYIAAGILGGVTWVHFSEYMALKAEQAEVFALLKLAESGSDEYWQLLDDLRLIADDIGRWWNFR